ncbi:MAG: DUF973 family protein [Caldisericia bacterium]
MKLNEAKLLGGLGAIFMLCFIIPKIGWILFIAGIILSLLAVNQISKIVNEKSIFNNYLVSVILYLASIVTTIVSVVILAFKIIIPNLDKFENFENWSRFNRFGIRDYHPLRNLPKIKEFLTNFSDKIWIVLIILVVIWIILIVAGLFTKFSFDKIGEKIKINNFKVAGLLIFIGSILTILFGLGFIIIFIGIIFQLISFLSLSEKYEEHQNNLTTG